MEKEIRFFLIIVFAFFLLYFILNVIVIANIPKEQAQKEISVAFKSPSQSQRFFLEFIIIFSIIVSSFAIFEHKKFKKEVKEIIETKQL